MMRTVFVILCSLLLGTGTAAQAFPDERFCRAHEDVVSHLGEHYGENPIALGLAGNGSVIEVFVSEKGSFTIVTTVPGGLTCFVAAGDNWESVPLARLVKGDGV